MDLPVKDIISPLVAVACVAVGAALNHFLSSRRFSREQLWERKLEAYSEILVGLSRAIRGYDGIAETISMHGGDMWQNPSFANQVDRLSSHLGEARNVFESNSLILSPEFAARFANLDADIGALYYENLDPPEEFDARRKLLNAAYPELRQQAEKEIKQR